MRLHETERTGMEDNSRQDTLKKYLTLISVINSMENRLRWTELVLLTLNVVIFMFSFHYISAFMQTKRLLITPLELSFILVILVIGMFICSYWASSSLRLHLKLKLHFFHLRFLERQLDDAGEFIFSDEAIFFNPSLGSLESTDKKENLTYPTEGLTRMDGFIGAAKPNFFSWLIPSIFFVLYWAIFIWISIKFSFSAVG